jgi:hypothetical protein
MLPVVDAALNIEVYRAFERALRAGLVASSVSVERGGLAVALARSAMGGQLGAVVSLLRRRVLSPMTKRCFLPRVRACCWPAWRLMPRRRFERILDAVTFPAPWSDRWRQLVFRRGAAALLMSLSAT